MGKWYWGDIHAHCGVSYGTGLPERALNAAKEHLDFCSITGHAFWPDIPKDPGLFGKSLLTHLGGFAKLQLFWRDLLALQKKYCKPGRFVTFPGYEWHSMSAGDHNCYSADFAMPLITGDTLDELETHVKKQDPHALILPHHIAYPKGFRGIDWDRFDSRRSPLVELFSNHGCGEADDAPYEYHHAMGPRIGENCIREGLGRGHKFGFIAGTDSHNAYPGHYGHGCFAVYADRLDLPSLWKAMRERRTIAVTGARITAQARLGDAAIGGETDCAETLPFELEAEGSAPIAGVDLIEGKDGEWRLRSLSGAAMHTDCPPGRYKVKLEAGWGRTPEPSSWNMTFTLDGGTIVSAEPCFRYNSTPETETEASERIIDLTERRLVWTCRTAPNPAGALGGTHFNPGGTQAVTVSIEATPQSRLVLDGNGRKVSATLDELRRRSAGSNTGYLGSPALKIHRAASEDEYRFRFKEQYKRFSEGPCYLYVRVRQFDGQAAWLSPFWYR
jgi:hypothetical protein